MTEKKQRTSNAIVIVQTKVGNAWEDLEVFDNPDSDALKEAQKWINGSGENGVAYRVIRAWPAVKVMVEQNPRRIVRPA